MIKLVENKNLSANKGKKQEHTCLSVPLTLFILFNFN